ncbi:MAG: transglycosylase SLT domain-containing protein [Chloroflexi bacterium]|nr:transglycosylase SLT domain-containing protein [Chloroflexota bacterium]
MRKQILFVLVVSVLLTACGTSSSPQPTPPPDPTLEFVIVTPTPEPADAPTPVFSSDPFNDGLVARRNGDYARAIAAFNLVLASNPAGDLKAEAQYRLGEAYWLYNDDTRALTALTTYLQANPNGTRVPETRYLLADAYRAKKDYANALEQLRIYRGLTQTLIGDTDATIADVMVLAGDATSAVAQYDRALLDTTQSAGARINMLMRVADLHQGRGEPALAGARYDAALALASDARTRADLLRRAGDAYAAANKIDLALARWNDALKYPEQNAAYQSLVNLINRGAPVDDYTRGIVDYYAAAYDAAIAALQRELKDDSSRAGEVRYFLARSQVGKGAYSQAIAEYDAILKNLPKDKRVTDAYLGKAAAYAAIGKLDDAVAVYKKFAATLPDDALADDALWRAALLLERAKRYGDAALLFEQVHAKFPARERASEALFWAGMDHYRGKDFKTAMARWQTITKEYAKSSFYARALFWLGKAAQTRGQTADAKNYWTQAAATPDSYYAWRARDLLNPPKTNTFYDLARYAMNNDASRAEFEQWLAGWSKSDARVTTLVDAATRNDLNYRRGTELLRLDRTVEARREFATLVAEKQDDARVLYTLAMYFRDNNLYSLALECAEKIARLATAAGAPAAPRFLMTMRYPTYYADLVVAEAQKNQVDPLLYFALIRQESSFNPWVTSSADARGLGQVMPATGRGIAQALGVRNFTLDQLYLPFVSVRFGVWYFAQDLKTYNEPIYALAAYNAGAGRVKNWQRNDLDFAVEEIDIAETASYVRIVYTNWRQYQVLYK